MTVNNMKQQDFINKLAQKKALVALTAELDEHIATMLNKKRDLMDEIDEITKSQIDARKDEIGQLEADIEVYLKETGVTKLSTERLSCSVTNPMEVKITNQELALDWLKLHPEALKKDIIKSAEMDELMQSGVVPDPKADGIDVSGTYTKIVYRRK